MTYFVYYYKQEHFLLNLLFDKHGIEMSDLQNSLTDDQISKFLTDGYLDVELNLDPREHSSIYFETDRLFQTLKQGANPHNNIVPMVPNLYDVLNDVNLKSALTSLVGPNYLLHPHRHCHTNFPKNHHSKVGMLQPFHKDGHAHRPRPRHREPRWLILFYSPQDTPLHRGPTAVIPGSHLLRQLSAEQESRTLPSMTHAQEGFTTDSSFYIDEVRPLTGAPRAVLCHFDLGHGAMVNSSVLPRYVHKFVVMRTEEPTPRPDLSTVRTADPIHAHLWEWLGRTCELHGNPETDINAWRKRLQSANQIESARAIYESQLIAKTDYDAAIEILEAQVARELAGYSDNEVLNTADSVNGLVKIGAFDRLHLMLNSDAPALVASAAYGLGQLRDAAALPKLRELMDHPNNGVVRHAISAIGIISSATHTELQDTLDTFACKFDEEADWDIRLFIVQAVIRMGILDDAMPLLCRAASDENAYVNSFAIEQLCRFDTDVARQAVIEPLRRQRWFPDPVFAI